MACSFFPAGIPLSKRLFDILSSLIVILLLSPFFLLITIAVWFDLGWPVFFIQERPGYHGALFCLRKFKTMRDLRPGEDAVSSDSERITRFGRILRASSLDELPELFSIFSGKMSVVGPRPLLSQYLPLYSAEQMRRHDVLPGLTGWAQINGRNNLSWEEKFRLDVWYVDHWSFWLDLKIIFLTIWKVLRREGIAQKGEATAREWQGNQPSSSGS